MEGKEGAKALAIKLLLYLGRGGHGSKITVDIDYSLEKKSYDKSRQCIKKQRHHFTNKGPSTQSYCFSSSHEWT